MQLGAIIHLRSSVHMKLMHNNMKGGGFNITLIPLMFRLFCFSFANDGHA